MSASNLVNLGSQVIELKDENLKVVADLHLCASRPQEIVAFANEVSEYCNQHSVLLILGDLFDVYVGPENLRAIEFSPLFAAFEQFAETGRVVLVRGNRDVLLESSHVDEFSFEVCDVVLSEDSQQRVLYVHGDAFCTADLSYQRLRRALRNRALRLMLRLLPVAVRRHLGRKMRKASVAEIARKEMSEIELNIDAVAAAAEQVEASKVVIGHLHRAQHQQIGENRELVVLAAWQPQLTRG